MRSKTSTNGIASLFYQRDGFDTRRSPILGSRFPASDPAEECEPSTVEMDCWTRELEVGAAMENSVDTKRVNGRKCVEENASVELSSVLHNCITYTKRAYVGASAHSWWKVGNSEGRFMFLGSRIAHMLVVPCCPFTFAATVTIKRQMRHFVFTPP